MSQRVLYDIEAAAEQVSQSVKTIRRAIHSTDPTAFPPPLRAKRMGDRPNSPYAVRHEDLEAWAKSLKDA